MTCLQISEGALRCIIHLYKLLKACFLWLYRLQVIVYHPTVTMCGAAVNIARTLLTMVMAVIVGLMVIMSAAQFFILIQLWYRELTQEIEDPKRPKNEIPCNAQRNQDFKYEPTEEKLRFRRPEKPKPQPKPKPKPYSNKTIQCVVDDRAVYLQWFAECGSLLSHRETMTRFPEPPAWPCPSNCQTNLILKACPHTIARLYRASGADLRQTLKEEKKKWHPDRFQRCPEPWRQEMVAKAQEMFKIIGILMDGDDNVHGTARSRRPR